VHDLNRSSKMDDGILSSNRSESIIEDYLSVEFPYFRLRTSGLISRCLSCELQANCNFYQNPSSLASGLAEIWTLYPEFRIAAARDLLIEDHMDIVFWHLAEHLKVIRILIVPGSLIVNPTMPNLNLNEFKQINELTRQGLLKRSCDIATLLAAKPLKVLGGLPQYQPEIISLCSIIIYNSENQNAGERLTEIAFQAERAALGWLVSMAPVEYLSTLEFLKLKMSYRAADDKDAFDKWIERDKNHPPDYRITGCRAAKATPAKPHKYLKTYLEHAYFSWVRSDNSSTQLDLL
jgi:hypothetical protein